MAALASPGPIARARSAPVAPAGSRVALPAGAVTRRSRGAIASVARLLGRCGWSGRWQERGVFRPRPDGAPYVIVIPPPNVTAILHVGHGLNNIIQDVLIRFERMRGRAAEWLPGTDHAGIATQNVVERLLADEGKTRFDIGREAFVERVGGCGREAGTTR